MEMNTEDINHQAAEVMDNVKFMDDAILKAWQEKYPNIFPTPPQYFVQGFLSGCRFANDYIMEEYIKSEKK